MISVYDKEKLRELLKDFYTVVGIRISIFDNQFDKICEYPEEYPKICSLIRESESGQNACISCDEQAFDRAKKMERAHMYTCHAGITEIVTPIMLGDSVAGYAIFAHLMPAENHDDNVKAICENCKRYSLSEETVKEALSHMKTRTVDEIYSSIHLLEAIAAYLEYNNVVTWEKEDLSYKLDKYIRDNISSKITSETLCSKFYISRTKLYHVSEESFGMGIGQYISQIRIEEAKKHLEDDVCSIAAVAETVGINDYNYFCKVFKSAVGMTPGKYRNQFKNRL